MSCSESSYLTPLRYSSTDSSHLGRLAGMNFSSMPWLNYQPPQPATRNAVTAAMLADTVPHFSEVQSSLVERLREAEYQLPPALQRENESAPQQSQRQPNGIMTVSSAAEALDALLIQREKDPEFDNDEQRLTAENSFSKGLLGQPDRRRNGLRIIERNMPKVDRTLVPQPVTESPVCPPRPLLVRPVATDAFGNMLMEPLEPQTVPHQRHPQSSGTLSRRFPPYVPFATRPLGHDDVHWEPPLPPKAKKKLEDVTTTATIVEAPIPPPRTGKEFIDAYRLREVLTAYDDNESFAFRPRPVACGELVARFYDDLIESKRAKVLHQQAQVVHVVHGHELLMFSGNRQSLLRFAPYDARPNTPSGGWQYAELTDASVFEVSGFPPIDAPLVPIPNSRFIVAPTMWTLHILDLEGHCWHLVYLKGLKGLKRAEWAHVIDHATLYVRNIKQKAHGIIPLEEVVVQLEELRRGIKDDERPLICPLFSAIKPAYVACTLFPRPPCDETLIALHGVPGMAIAMFPESHHGWLHYFNTSAKNFIPWQRIEIRHLMYCALDDHLQENSMTVFFFDELLHRVDIGTLVDERTQVSALTQKVVRPVVRLTIRHPRGEADDPALASNAPRVEVNTEVVPPAAAAQGIVGLQRPTRSAPTVKRSVHRATTLKPLGATSDFVERLTLQQISQKESDIVLRAQHSQIAEMVPLFDRCVAVMSFDYAGYVIIELDRSQWLKKIQHF